ncbi:MAG: rhomboid family intramembrane serine protease [Syntrophothermus sp.]
MLFPIGDDNRDRNITPFINYILIALNIFVFVYYQSLGTNQEFIYAYSMVPAEIIKGKDIVTDDRVYEDELTGEKFNVPGLQPTPIPVLFTFFTSMFMHASIAHIFGNMLFLLIFGDNLENRIGHLRYLIFYLVTGLFAGLSQVFITLNFGGDAFIPTLGASGAISGVLGGYLMLFPTRRVRVMIFYIITEVPALVALGLWFVFQLFSGFSSLGNAQGGVAFAAHIGGFVSGFLLIRLFAIGTKKWPPQVRKGFFTFVI